MTFAPRTVWAVECNRCGVSFTDPDDDAEVLLLDTVEGADSLAAEMRRAGWVAVGGTRHFCPPCAVVEQAAVMDRLAIETTHEPLQFDGGEA